MSEQTNHPTEPARGEAGQILRRHRMTLLQRFARGTPAVDEALSALMEAERALYGLSGEPITPERLERAIRNDPLLAAVFALGRNEGHARAQRECNEEVARERESYMRLCIEVTKATGVDVPACGMTALQAVEELRAQLAAAHAGLSRVRTVANEMVASFTHPGHPGRPCLQSGWIDVVTVARWRDALDHTRNPPAAQGGE